MFENGKGGNRTTVSECPVCDREVVGVRASRGAGTAPAGHGMQIAVGEIERCDYAGQGQADERGPVRVARGNTAISGETM